MEAKRIERDNLKRGCLRGKRMVVVVAGGGWVQQGEMRKQ